MKVFAKAVSFGLVLLLFVSCVIINTTKPVFEDSNQMLIEETVKGLTLGHLKLILPEKSKVVLTSIEKDITLDTQIIATIEDNIISSLLKDGFIVLERDKNSIGHFERENNRQENKKEAEVNTAGLSSEEYKKVIQLLKKEGYSAIERDLTSIPYTSVLNSNVNAKNENLATCLSSADYLISYRILECGIIYRNKPNKATSYLTRESRVRLHVRVQDAKTGKILFADNVNSVKEKDVKAELVNPLANFHYSVFYNQYPLQQEYLKADKNLQVKSTGIKE